MTLAYLPVLKVLEACRLTRLDFYERGKVDLEIAERGCLLIAKGEWTPERAAVGGPAWQVDRDRRDHQERRVEAISTLAKAMGEGVIALDADDFRCIASRYRQVEQS